jgi:hypothetical protein
LSLRQDNEDDDDTHEEDDEMAVEGGDGASKRVERFLPSDIKSFERCLASIKGMDMVAKHASMPLFTSCIEELDNFVEQANSPAKGELFLKMLAGVGADAAKKMANLVSGTRHMEKVATNMSKHYFHSKIARELEQVMEASEELIMLYTSATYLSYNFRYLSAHGRLQHASFRDDVFAYIEEAAKGTATGSGGGVLRRLGGWL